jgi:hypothetical protein
VAVQMKALQERDATQKKAQEEKEAAQKKAQEEKEAAQKKAQEEKDAARKKAKEEEEALRQKTANDALEEAHQASIRVKDLQEELRILDLETKNAISAIESAELELQFLEFDSDLATDQSLREKELNVMSLKAGRWLEEITEKQNSLQKELQQAENVEKTALQTASLCMFTTF